MTTALAITPAVAPVIVCHQASVRATRKRANPIILLADEAPTALEQHAARLGFPNTLFGFTPNQHEYWAELSLPWLTPAVQQNPPLGYNGFRLIFWRLELTNNSMAPRFPKGCWVNVARVFERKNLVAGRVYYYEWEAENGEVVCQMARLLSIHDTYLVVQCDNARSPFIWALPLIEREAMRNLWEVTHYVHYPLDIA